MANYIDIRIYYEDTDCGGVVYYGKYLSYLERARTEYLEERGIILTTLMQQGLQFVVVHVDIRYHSPAKYADIISVHSEVDSVNIASIVFKHKIAQKGSGALIASSQVKLAVVDRSMKLARLTPEMVELLGRR
ncbi:MAG: YbgC/FadM family acyl-CoA thioesterase [Nitrospirae bacterium]|nr:YbgC/FadM family acyl-CoA thioesterase [Nitrospirota bacterium]